MFTFFGNVTSVLIVYSFTNKNSFHGTLMPEKDMFRVYWKKRCSSIPVLSKSTTNALMWWDYFASPARVKPPKGWSVIKL